ncbi:MAG TPA: PQQ-dependent sugar dehydrogenase [Solirubrobacteraceae bacterium]|nr:PQQ-dependent sugar dehydrogenase [Solirubrobacteraceae bacterium]
MARTALTLAALATFAVLAACGTDEGAAGSATTTSAPTSASSSGSTATTQAKPSAADGVRLVGIGTFDAPVYVTAPPADNRRVFVVEQGGTIRVIVGGKRRSRPFLDIRSRVTSGGEQGLLSMAFAPDYAKTRRFYVNYTDRAGDQRVVEYRRSRARSDRADAGSARLVLIYRQPEANHNGGLVTFGPDKLLYIGTGDGGGANDQHGSRGNAQNLDSLLGKLLRVDPRRSGGRAYRVPSSNPFADRSGARSEIYSYGLRNPWRFSFDRRTGDLTIADVGQNAVEEVNFAKKGRARGANYGWRPLEGTRRNFDEPAPNAVAPVIELAHDDGNCSITGGYVVRDPNLRALAGRYVYGDFCVGRLRSAKLSQGSARGDGPIPGLKKVEQLSSFGEDARGRVYVTSLNGPVYRLSAG